MELEHCSSPRGLACTCNPCLSPIIISPAGTGSA